MLSNRSVISAELSAQFFVFMMRIERNDGHVRQAEYNERLPDVWH